MSNYKITIDEDACWGCQTCEVACKQEMNTPEDIRLIAVAADGPRIADGKPVFLYQVNLCRHCEEPACLEACPDEAIRQRPDGIVILDEGACSGCRAWAREKLCRTWQAEQEPLEPSGLSRPMPVFGQVAGSSLPFSSTLISEPWHWRQPETAAAEAWTFSPAAEKTVNPSTTSASTLSRLPRILPASA